LPVYENVFPLTAECVLAVLPDAVGMPIPGANAVTTPSAGVVVAAADITAAAVGEVARTAPLFTAAVAEEAAVLHLPSQKPREFVFGRIGKTPPETVL
jgi:hypothetical protein